MNIGIVDGIDPIVFGVDYNEGWRGAEVIIDCTLQPIVDLYGKTYLHFFSFNLS